MDAALYFELVDAVARVDGPAELAAVTARVNTTSMHPMERRILDRSLRARGEAIALQTQLMIPDLFLDSPVSEPNPLSAGG
jgi:hypothetical protein